MEPSAGVPGPTGNQHFQMPLNSWLSEAEKLLVPPQHHRLVNKSSVYSSVRILRWVWGSCREEQLRGWMLGKHPEALPTWPHAQDSVGDARMVGQVLRDHPTLLLLSTSQQTPTPPLLHEGLMGLRGFGMVRSRASHPSRPWRLSNASKAAIFRAGAARYFYKYINLFKEKQI